MNGVFWEREDGRRHPPSICGLRSAAEGQRPFVKSSGQAREARPSALRSAPLLEGDIGGRPTPARERWESGEGWEGEESDKSGEDLPGARPKNFHKNP